MFLGLEALDEEGLKAFRKRTTPKVNNKALEVARSMGLSVAINIIADPDWDEARFAFVREWAMSVPEIVNITVQTPYPGTETWLTEARRMTTLDYRLFDVQHAVLPTRLPLHASTPSWSRPSRSWPASTSASPRSPRPPGSSPGNCCTARLTSPG